MAESQNRVSMMSYLVMLHVQAVRKARRQQRDLASQLGVLPETAAGSALSAQMTFNEAAPTA